MKHLSRLLWLFVFLACLPAGAQTSVAVISGQAVNQSGTPLPNALIRVCPVTSTGVPCTPLANIYQDYGLTVPAPNPWTSDNFGNYTLYVGPTSNPNLYTVQESPASGITWSYVQNGPFLSAAGGTLYGSLFAPDINGEIYPASCGYSTPPSWCSGNTADAWIRAACSQLPATGGIVNLLGLTGSIVSPVTCSTPTKQVIMLEDPTSLLTVTEIDGAITFPLDNGSMLLGPGAGQCANAGGIHLSGSANVTAIVGPAHTDGTQEDFTVNGVCVFGATGATVNKGLIYANKNYANTTISGNNAQVCNNACIWLQDLGGIVTVADNELSATSGDYQISGSPLVLDTDATEGTGCINQSLNIHGGNMEHANGGAAYPEINFISAGAGQLFCNVYIHDIYIERNVSGTPDTYGIKLVDCWNCSFTNVFGGGGYTPIGNDFINISQTATGRIYNAMLTNISAGGSWTNLVNDTTQNFTLPGSSVVALPAVSTYFSNPGYQQPPVLPQSTLQALGSDLLNGYGSFNTGSSSFGTNFGNYGCQPTSGVVCVYTRTNSTAPPNYTYSQEVQITTNTDPGGSNGIESSFPVSFTAGQSYLASFWVKGDGTINGLPTFILGDPTVPTQFCRYQSQTAFPATWTLISFLCTPSSTGTSYVSLSSTTPYTGTATGTVWFGGFIFAPVSPLPTSSLLTSVTPYGIGAATTAQQTVTVNGVACQLQGTCTVSSGTTGATGTYANPSSITVANGLTTSVTAGSGATGTYSSPASITTSNGVVTSVTAGSSSLVTKTLIINTGICTASGGSYSTCTDSAVNWPSAFADTAYTVVCQGLSPSNSGGSLSGQIFSVSKTTTSITISLQTNTSSGFTYGEIDCVGTHP